MDYNARYIHKISSSPNDTDGPFEIDDSAFSNKNKLAKAMRDAGILDSGDRLRNFRVEGEKVITFPAGRSIWHAIVLEPAENYVPNPGGVQYPGYHGRAARHRSR